MWWSPIQPTPGASPWLLRGSTPTLWVGDGNTTGIKVWVLCNGTDDATSGGVVSGDAPIRNVVESYPTDAGGKPMATQRVYPHALGRRWEHDRHQGLGPLQRHGRRHERRRGLG